MTFGSFAADSQDKKMKWWDDAKFGMFIHWGAYSVLAKKIDETFWHEESGIYRNRYVSGEWPVTESPTSFYPWLAGAVPPERSERLLASLCAVAGRIACYTGQLVRWVDLTENTKSPFYHLSLSPTAVDFEKGPVVMPPEVAPIPGEADPNFS